METLLGQSATDRAWEVKYSKLLFISLQNIINHHNLDSDSKEELLSVKNINLIVRVICEASLYGLSIYLPEDIRILLRISVPMKVDNVSNEERKILLQEAYETLKQFFQVKTLVTHSAMENVQLQFLYVAFYLENQEKINHCQVIFSRHQFFRHLMVLKGVRHSQEISKLLHKKLTEQLSNPGGFELLSRFLMKSSEPWKVGEIVAKICAAKGYSQQFYSKILEDAMKLLKIGVTIENQESFIPICVTCIKELHKIPKNQPNIEEKLTKWLKELYEITLNGAIVLTEDEYQSNLHMTCATFGGNAVSLPSNIISPYTIQLLKLYTLTPNEDKPSKMALKAILNHILKNSENLNEVVEQIFEDNETKLHLKYSNLSTVPSIVIGNTQQCDLQFINLIKDTENTMLMYKVLLVLLKIFETDVEGKGDLLHEDELPEFLSKKFRRKLLVIEAIQELINYKPLHGQFKENPEPILEFLDTFLENQLKKSNFDIENVQLTLTIFSEIIPDQEKLQKIIHRHEKLPEELKAYMRLVSGQTENKFQEAIDLVSRLEPHLKVNGLMQMVELIKQKDEETCANKFKILAIAMQNLKNDESYTYLNTVKLLVALTTLIEAEVIEYLLNEFNNEGNDIDLRLKVAEVIVKVTEALGPMIFKYKKELINCFLRGCVYNDKKELRASSFSKLGTICRFLAFQVHSFFHEMLTVVQQTLQLDDYKPSRRAAVMLLNQLLQGMENILDFQEFLLPVYRTLKNVIAVEEDEVTRIQAALSLETLNKLTKEFLNPEEKVQINLRIHGVKEHSQIDIKYK